LAAGVTTQDNGDGAKSSGTDEVARRALSCPANAVNAPEACAVPSADQPAIVVRALSKRYGAIQALDGIDLDIARGEVFGLLGRNGSGKTTTVRILTTLTAPTSGRAEVFGTSVVDRPAVIRRRIGATMQEAALDPGMTGREHLRLAAGLWGMPRRTAAAQAAELLERFGLTEAADRRIGTYSGGMQRRLDIATALLSGPSALFLDEPTAGLDPQSRRALWEEIRTLSREGTTILLTTQYLEEAEALTGRVAVIDAGRIVAEGSVAALKARHGRTRLDFRPARADDVRRALAALEGERAIECAGSVRVELDPAQAARRVADIVAGLRDRRIELASIAVRESSLEDVFVQLTGAAIERDAA
jgi:ABC-2 type transport system ATP-binding protein